VKVEDLSEIIKRELRGTNMYEYLEGSSGDHAWVAYKNFQLKSFKKLDGKWHVTAQLLKEGDSDYTIVRMVLNDETGEVTDMAMNPSIAFS